MTENILHYLKLKRSPPTLEYLQELITAYCSTVPWENVSKTIKKRSTENINDCLRLENEFWTSAFRYGTGGTCYESNWAFFGLLQNLGFDGYLTINKVIDKSSVHAASVILIGGRKYIADIGYPTYAPIRITEDVVTVSDNSATTYRCTPASSNEYIIENLPHPKPYLYHLMDLPVDPADYLKIASQSYAGEGTYPNRIVIRKVINKVPTRFDSEDLPYNIHTLQNGEKIRTFINDEDLIERLSDHFGLNEELISHAFTLLNKTEEKHVMPHLTQTDPS